MTQQVRLVLSETNNVVPLVAANPKVRANRVQDVDRFVGRRIRERRIMLGLTQQDMAHLIGVTYQQAHKYERGINRISAARLYGIARALDVPISYFFEGLEEGGTQAVNPRQRMALELARSFGRIRSDRHQEALNALARARAPPESLEMYWAVNGGMGGWIAERWSGGGWGCRGGAGAVVWCAWRPPGESVGS
ncbi:MAG: XRE family transcriptional regulator, partial [Alphaproteobacteria bacterium]|nr:XRE family transcriptional regulator [Alphaproteobacteria bacterium]